MAIEIERKFVVTSDGWRGSVVSSRRIRQGYIVRTGALSVRVRSINGDAFLTLNNRVPGIAREEFEYAIPLDDCAANRLSGGSAQGGVCLDRMGTIAVSRAGRIG